MKVITVKQPWASLIVEGIKIEDEIFIKDVENRTWYTKLRGRVLIHASAKPVKDGMEALNPIQIEASIDWFKNSKLVPDFGCIIGSVEIVDCVINHSSIWAEKTNLEACAKLNEPIVYNWVLANPEKLACPIPAKGKLSFWEYPMTEEEYSNLEKISL